MIIGIIVNLFRWTQLAKIFHESPLTGRRLVYFFYNKLNKLQIKLLWVFINYNKVLGSIRNRKFLNLSDPLNDFFIEINKSKDL